MSAEMGWIGGEKAQKEAPGGSAVDSIQEPAMEAKAQCRRDGGRLSLMVTVTQSPSRNRLRLSVARKTVFLVSAVAYSLS